MKKYPLVVSLTIPYWFKEYGLFGGLDSGFYVNRFEIMHLSNPYILYMLYLIDGKFVKSDKKYYKEY